MKFNLLATRILCVGLFLFLANDGFCAESCGGPSCFTPPPPSAPDIAPWFADGLMVTNAELVITGYVENATDLEWRLENADGTTDYQPVTRSGWAAQYWSADVTGLIGGTNVLRIRATNDSALVTEAVSHVFFLQNTPLSAAVIGNGTVKPNLDGEILQSGNHYRMTAKLGKDSVFAGWSGDVTSSDTALTFMMRSNTVIQANFAPNPFTPVAGTYEGAIMPTIIALPQFTGSFKTIVSKKGKFSAKFQLGDETYRLSGTFLADGSYSGFIRRKKLPNNPIKLQLRLDINNRTISGAVTDTSFSSNPTGQLTAAYSKR